MGMDQARGEKITHPSAKRSETLDKETAVIVYFDVIVQLRFVSSPTNTGQPEQSLPHTQHVSHCRPHPLESASRLLLHDPPLDTLQKRLHSLPAPKRHSATPNSTPMLHLHAQRLRNHRQASIPQRIRQRTQTLMQLRRAQDASQQVAFGLYAHGFDCGGCGCGRGFCC